MTRCGWRTAGLSLSLITLVALNACSSSANANTGPTIDGVTSITHSATIESTVPLITPLPTTASTTSTSTTSTSTTTTIGPPIALDVNMSRDVGLIASNATTEEAALVDQLIDRCRDLYPGSNRSIAVAVSHHGQFVASWTIGRDNYGNSIDLDARFRIASMSKLLTALAVMRLVETGAISLDVPFVEQYDGYDGEPYDSRFVRITPRHLLQHTSGLPGLKGSFFRGSVNDWHEAVEVAYERGMYYSPGTQFHYTNANFVLLGALIEQASGLSYEDAVRQMVLDPLGIVTADLIRTEEQPEGDPGYVVSAGRLYMEALGPAGGWVMTATDAARLMAAFDPSIAPLVLDAETIAQMSTWSGIDTDLPDDYQYGLGLMLVGWYIGHTGTIESARTFALLLPNGYAVTVMTSTEDIATGTTLISYFRGEIDALAQLPA